jgi:hypothetical protein
MTNDSFRQSPECQRCGAATSPLYSFLDPTTGRTFRSFKCACGDQTVLAVTQAAAAESERKPSLTKQTVEAALTRADALAGR